MVGFFPFLFKGMGPHELPVAQVVYLAPLLLGHDTGQVLLPSLKKDTNKLGLNRFQMVLKEQREMLWDNMILTNVKFPLSKPILAV